MNRILYTLILICALAAASAASFAQSTPPAATAPPQLIDPSAVPAPGVLSALRLIALQSYPVLETQLKLTDAQKPQVRGLLEKAEARFKPLIEAQRNAGRAFVEALASKTDEAKLISLGQAATKGDADLIAEKVKTVTAIRALLTGQQNTDLNALLGRISLMWKTVPRPVPNPPQPSLPTK